MILDHFSLNGKCGLVTGAGSGIGKALAQGLAEAGAKVALAGRNVAKLEDAAGAINSAGLHAAPFQVDMAKPESIGALAASVLDAFGRIDFLFNNAGMIHRAPAEDFPLDKWEEMIKVNLTGPFLLSQAVARHLIAQGTGGSIVNTSPSFRRSYSILRSFSLVPRADTKSTAYTSIRVPSTRRRGCR